MRTLQRAMLLLAALAMLQSAHAAVTLKTNTLALTMSDEGTVTGLRDLINDRDILGAADLPFASIRINGEEASASAAKYAGDALELAFGETGVTARLAVRARPNYIAFKLASVTGPDIEHITFARLPVTPLGHFGNWLNTVWDDRFALCFMAANVETDCRSSRSDAHDCILCRARAHSDVKLAGAEFAVLAAPRDTVLDAIDAFEVDYGLPRGGRQRQLPDQKWSYFWPRPTPQTIDEDINWALRGGFKQLCISYTAFSSSAGSFPWRASYPNGLDDLKAVVAKVKDAGLSPGLHIHFNKAHKYDPLVTPVPDPRLYKDRRIELAADVDKRADFLPTAAAPEGWPTDNGQRDLQIGDEIVQYAKLSLREPFGFAGCRRGALGTDAAPHDAGDTIYRLGVDRGWPIFIRFDQSTDIQGEVAEHIGRLYSEGGFQWAYFDGSEDVYQPFWYLCAKAQLQVYRRMAPEPTTSEAAAAPHFSWHMMSRSNAYDSVQPEQLKDFCRRYPCRRARRNAENFTGVDFGWLRYAPHGSDTIGTQPDHIEYYWSRAAAWDCPVALHTTPSRLKQNARTTDNIDIIRRWERAKLDGWLTDAQKQTLRNLRQEHILLINERGERELRPYDRIDDCAGGDDRIRAFIFERDGDPWIVFWHTWDAAMLTLDLPPENIRLFRPLDTELEVGETEGGKVAIEFSDRRFLRGVGLTRDEVIDAFRAAKVRELPGTHIWVPAADFERKVGEMALGSGVGLTDDGALADFIVSTGRPNRNQPKDWYCEYTVEIPRAGMWRIWGHFRYPAAADHSFGFVLPGEKLTLSGNQVFGNSGSLGDAWHWDSRGGGSTSVPGTAFVTRYLDAGPVTFRIYAREGTGDVNTNPRLDVILLTRDAAFVPNDSAAREALAAGNTE